MGLLSEAEIEIVESHLMYCEQCQDKFALAEEFSKATRQAALELMYEPRPEAVAWWKRIFEIPKPVFAFAACAVLAVAILIPTGQKDAVVELQAMRSQEISTQAPSNRGLQVNLSLEGIASKNNLRAELADSTGRILTGKSVEAINGKGSVHFDKLAAGSYWVRLYSGQEMLREYALNVR